MNAIEDSNFPYHNASEPEYLIKNFSICHVKNGQYLPNYFKTLGAGPPVRLPDVPEEYTSIVKHINVLYALMANFMSGVHT